MSKSGKNSYSGFAQAQSSTPPPPSSASITNGVAVTSTIRFSQSNLTLIASSTASFTDFQENFKERLIYAAKATGYSGQLLVSIDAVRPGSVVVDSTTLFQQATSFVQPQAFADALTNQVTAVFAGSSYFLGLQTGIITSTNVTVTAAVSDGATAKKGSKGITKVVWIVLGLGGALAVAVVCILYVRYSLRKEEEYLCSPVMEENEDLDYDPQEAYAQLVAEAQGYEREHPKEQKDEEKISMPAMPEESPYHGPKQTKHTVLRVPRGIFPIGRRKATSGPIMFTSAPDTRSGPVVPPKNSVNGGESGESLPNAAPSRLRNLIRSISGPVKVVWPSPPRGGGGLGPNSRAPSGNWSGLLSGRWSGMLAPQKGSVGSSKRFSGPIDMAAKRFSGPIDSSTPSSRRGGGVGDVSRADDSDKSVAGSAIKMAPRPPLAPGTDSPASRRVFSGPLSHLSTPGPNGSTAPPQDADVYPLFTPGQRQDSAAEPPQPMALLRSDSYKWFRGATSLKDLDFPSGPLTMGGGGDNSSSLAQMRRPPQHAGAPSGSGGKVEVRKPSMNMGGDQVVEVQPATAEGGGGLRRQESGPPTLGDYLAPRNKLHKHVSGPIYFA